jgi:hypothetical protein
MFTDVIGVAMLYEGIIVIALVLLALTLSLLLGFARHISTGEAALIALVVFLVLSYESSLHTVIRIVIALAVFGALYLLQSTKIGFWIFAIPATAFWSAFTAWITHDATNGDILWIVFTAVVIGLFALGLHYGVYTRKFNGEKQSRS